MTTYFIYLSSVFHLLFHGFNATYYEKKQTGNRDDNVKQESTFQFSYIPVFVRRSVKPYNNNSLKNNIYLENCLRMVSGGRSMFSIK